MTAPAASAEELAHTRVSLEFSAPAGCATIQQFEQRVHLRSERIVFVDQPPYTGSARVTLTETAADVRVRLTWTREGSGATGREFSAPSCTEAIDAAALVVTITFDPSAPGVLTPQVGDSPTSSADPSADAGAAGSTGGEAKDDLATDDTTPTNDGETQALDIPATDAGAPRRESTTSGRIVVSANAAALVEGISGVAPTALSGLGLAAAVSIGKGWFIPEFRLQATHFFEVTYPADGGDAQFAFDAAKFEICPFRFGRREFSLRPCAAALGGRLEASGTDTTNPQRHTRPLWAFGGSLLASVRPVGVLLFTGEVGVSAPLSRDVFQFEPAEFHQVAAVLVSGSFGLGFEIP